MCITEQFQDEDCHLPIRHWVVKLLLYCVLSGIKNYKLHKLKPALRGLIFLLWHHMVHSQSATLSICIHHVEDGT